MACCVDRADGEASVRIKQALEDRTDWEELLQLAQRHGLTPLVYRRLASELDVNQQASLEGFRRADAANARRTLALTAELLNVCRHLADRGLEVLPYKGPVLAEHLYGNVALGLFSDLDILVRACDLAPVRKALAELGCEPSLHLGPAVERAYLKSGYEYTLDCPRGRNLLEIHWQILPRFYAMDFDIERLFARAITVSLQGQPLRTLCDQDLMLVLCVHAAKQGWRQVSWLCDIVRLARSRAIDWKSLTQEAARLGIARIVSVTFRLAQRLLGATPPLEFSTGADSALESLSQNALPWITGEQNFDPESRAYFRLMTALRERGRDRASFLWRLSVTPGAGEWSAIRLPGPLFPLYRGVRMLRLGRRFLMPPSA